MLGSKDGSNSPSYVKGFTDMSVILLLGYKDTPNRYSARKLSPPIPGRANCSGDIHALNAAQAEPRDRAPTDPAAPELARERLASLNLECH